MYINTEKEVWKDIDGYEGSYQVSNYGRVRSKDRVSFSGRKLKGRVLKQHVNKGYYMIGLYKKKMVNDSAKRYQGWWQKHLFQTQKINPK